MKIFISWSGERSRKVAELLNTWIQCVLQVVDPWLSSKDIDRGSLWFSEITSQLSNTHNGIVCLTKANLNKPWILFEAGALAKGLTSNKVYTLLIDLTSNDIKDPLAQFNHTLPTKDEIYQLVRTINNSLNNQSLKENILQSVFDTYWSQFDKEFKQILKETKEEDIIETRSKDDILNEILYSVRGFDKRLRQLEEIEAINKSSYLNKSWKSPSRSLINFLNVPIEALDLSVRAFNYLKSNRINTLEEFISLDNEKLHPPPDNIKEELETLAAKYLQ